MLLLLSGVGEDAMNRYIKGTTCPLFLSLTLAGVSQAKEWRGIVPLHSSRADVHKILGEPTINEGNVIEGFDIDGVRVLVMYSRTRCQRGLPADWGNWNVPPGTVVDIRVPFAGDARLAELKIPDIEKYKWYADDSGATYYHDKKEGLRYSVNRLGFVDSITYGPTEADLKLLCKKDAPVIRY
ncbi:MAG TPA: hypothetical protein VF659_06355 [Pyrinomonadaceae bacterium]